LSPPRLALLRFGPFPVSLARLISLGTKNHSI
jgi:hypothetical protein